MYNAVFHIDLDEEKPLQIGLNNMTNLLKAIDERPHELIMLFNGPAVKLFADMRINPFVEQMDALRAAGAEFQVCRNALNAFEIADALIPEGFTVIPAGIVALIELQQQGFAYIKP